MQLPAIVVSEVRWIVVLLQLSVADGADDNALEIPIVLEHSRAASSDPAVVEITGAVLSLTLIVCVNVALVLPQASVKFHVLILV
jgi:hypothetical protein